MSATPTFGRDAEMPVDQMSPEQREGYRLLVDGPGDRRDRHDQPVALGVSHRGAREARHGSRAARRHGGSITDMIVLMGYYTAVSLTMNFYAVPAGSPGLAR